MAQIQKSQKPIATRPIKSGQPLGPPRQPGARSLHTTDPRRCPGCSAFAKIFFHPALSGADPAAVDGDGPYQHHHGLR